MKIQAAILSFIVGLGVIAHQGCGGIHENPGQGDDGSSSSLSFATSDAAGGAAFESGFYAFTKSQGCVKCHGVNQTPKFADPDVNVAYSFFKTLVNPADSSNSVIITYAGNGHCSDAVCSNPAVRPQVTSLLASWAAAENSGGGGSGSGKPKYLTASLAMPATIPLLGLAPAVLRFSLTSFGVPALTGALLEVELNRFNAGGNYRVARAKIMGNNALITVSGIHVYVRSSSVTGIGLEDPNQGLAWTGTNAVLTSTVLPNTLPTTPLTAAPMVTTSLSILPQSAADVMTIGIDDIVLGGTLAPAAVKFTDLISANQTLGIFTQSCVGCHSGGNPSAGLDLTNFNQAKAKAATIQIRANSLGAPMPPTGLTSAASRAVINSWVNGGALQ